MKPDRIVFGIDPGLARCGWAAVNNGSGPVLVAAGCLTTSPRNTESQRLKILAGRLRSLIKEYRPDVVALERLFFAKNSSTAMAVGQARGIAVLIAAEAGLTVCEFAPTAIKLAVAGDGRADKRQVQKMVMLLLGLKQAPKYDDTVDALAVALCGAQTNVLP